MIIVTCPECATRLSIPESAITKGIPTLTCPKCNKKFKPMIKQPVPQIPNPPINQVNSSKGADTDFLDQAPGWLVVHDENTKHQTFSLKLGKQIAGRKDPTRPCEIMIDTSDKYMSRNHFVIECKINRFGKVECVLSDNNAKNHTFINTKSLQEVKQNDLFLLSDGDIIQAGRTKIVFKSSNTVRTEKEAENSVKSTPKGRTVLV